MKQAGQPLHNLIGKDKHITLYLFKQILFQILFSLGKAQEACEFMHNDLHLKNILLDLPNRTEITKFHEYTHNENTWYVDSKVVITIVDFGLSRINLDDGKIIHNNVHSVFLPSVDIERLASEFSKFKFSSWSNSLNDENCTSEEENKEKKMKRNLLQQMRKGEKIFKLLKHPFFDSLQEKPKKVSDLIGKEEEENSKTINVTSPVTPSEIPPKLCDISASVLSKRSDSLTLSPMSVMLIQKSPVVKTCLPKLSVCISDVAESISTLQQKAFSKAKPVASLFANKENEIKNKITSVLKKRKPLSSVQPAPKKRRLL